MKQKKSLREEALSMKFRVNKNLNYLSGISLFPEKVAKANEILSKMTFINTKG